MPMGRKSAMGLVQNLHRRMPVHGPQSAHRHAQGEGDSQGQESARLASWQRPARRLASVLRRCRLRGGGGARRARCCGRWGSEPSK
eukprot:148699-Pyramimonas_sp.AAC.1